MTRAIITHRSSSQRHIMWGAIMWCAPSSQRQATSPRLQTSVRCVQVSNPGSGSFFCPRSGSMQRGLGVSGPLLRFERSRLAQCGAHRERVSVFVGCTLRSSTRNEEPHLLDKRTRSQCLVAHFDLLSLRYERRVDVVRRLRYLNFHCGRQAAYASASTRGAL